MTFGLLCHDSSFVFRLQAAQVYYLDETSVVYPHKKLTGKSFSSWLINQKFYKKHYFIFQAVDEQYFLKL